MHRIDAALADWTRLYQHLKDAQDRLDAMQTGKGEDRRLLTLEVSRLQEDSEAALKAVRIQLALIRGRPLQAP